MKPNHLMEILEVVAANIVYDTVLILRCKDQTTEAAFSTQYNYLGYKSVDVTAGQWTKPNQTGLEGVNEWSRCFCSRRRRVHSVITGQWETVDKDDAQH